MNATPEIQKAIAAYLITTNSLHTFVPVTDLDYRIVHPETDEQYPMTDKYMLQFIWLGKELAPWSRKPGTPPQNIDKNVISKRPFIISDFYNGFGISDKDKLIDNFLTHVRGLVKRQIDNYQGAIDRLNGLKF
jgi:hypothetical protein